MQARLLEKWYKVCQIFATKEARKNKVWEKSRVPKAVSGHSKKLNINSNMCKYTREFFSEKGSTKIQPRNLLGIRLQVSSQTIFVKM